jgi:hypothetical protein
VGEKFPPGHIFWMGSILDWIVYFGAMYMQVAFSVLDVLFPFFGRATIGCEGSLKLRACFDRRSLIGGGRQGKIPTEVVTHLRNSHGLEY